MRKGLLALLVSALLSCILAFAAAETSYSGLKKGDTGEAVLAARVRLQELGYFKKNQTKDTYNQEMEKAVLSFEKDYGLEADGELSAEDQAVLFTAIRKTHLKAVTVKAKVNKNAKVSGRVTGSTVTLSWKAAEGAASYVIARSISAKGEFEQIGTTADLSFTDEDAPEGTVYYRVTAQGENAVPADSKAVSAKVPAKIIEPSERMKEFMTAGNQVEFGHYEQDGNLDNGQEPIVWTVLEFKNNQALLISRDILDARAFDVKEFATEEKNWNRNAVKNFTWESCSLRKWLNSDFILVSFSEGEQTALVQTTLKNDSKEMGDRQIKSVGGDTEDRVFFLSGKEMKKYFRKENERIAEWTAYAKSKMKSLYDSCYWLRTEGYESFHFDFRRFGYGDDYLTAVYAEGIKGEGKLAAMTLTDLEGVRPVIRIDLHSDYFND